MYNQAHMLEQGGIRIRIHIHTERQRASDRTERDRDVGVKLICCFCPYIHGGTCGSQRAESVLLEVYSVGIRARRGEGFAEGFAECPSGVYEIH